MRDTVAFQEVSLFEPHASDAATTRYRSWIEVVPASWSGAKLVTYLPASSASILSKHIDTLDLRLRQLRDASSPTSP